MSEKVINVSLPAFAFVESSGHDGDLLKDRNVILHVRTASVVEVFPEESFFPVEGTITFRFKNINTLGADEYYVAALHYSATLDALIDKKEIIDRVLLPAARWFCDYCDWEDQNIINDKP